MDRRLLVVASAVGLVLLGLFVILAVLPGEGPAEPAAPAPAKKERVVKRFDTRPSPSPRPDGPVAAPRTGAPDAADPTDRVRAGDPPQLAIPAGEAGEAEANEEPVLYPLNRDGIRDAMTNEAEDIRRCYETILKDYPDTAGRIAVGFTISPEGVVTEADIEDSSAGSLYLEGCIVTVMEEVRFDPGDTTENTRVTWPFVFRASDPDPD